VLFAAALSHMSWDDLKDKERKRVKMAEIKEAIKRHTFKKSELWLMANATDAFMKLKSEMKKKREQKKKKFIQRNC
jgi:hypothetical protein